MGVVPFNCFIRPVAMERTLGEEMVPEEKAGPDAQIICRRIFINSLFLFTLKRKAVNQSTPQECFTGFNPKGNNSLHFLDTSCYIGGVYPLCPLVLPNEAPVYSTSDNHAFLGRSAKERQCSLVCGQCP